MTRAALVLLAAISGCAQDICAHRAEIGSDCDRPLSDAELAACDTSLATCSGDERQRLKTLYVCLEAEGYADCDAGGDFGGPSANQYLALLACEDDAKRISGGCLEAAGRTDLTTIQGL